MSVSFGKEDVLTQSSIRQGLISLLYRLADDELVMGHRDSEWLGLAPEIEEDVAFSSIAQDEVGHASFFFGLLQELQEGSADVLAFGRDDSKRLNSLMVERENLDWAWTIVRHLFYDIFDQIRLRALLASSYTDLKSGAQKILREEYYHQLHFKTWFVRLIRAGGESKQRTIRAIDTMWLDVPNLFELGDDEYLLIKAGLVSESSAQMRESWLHAMQSIFSEAGIETPSTDVWATVECGRTTHTPGLKTLLGVMSEVYDLQPGAIW